MKKELDLRMMGQNIHRLRMDKGWTQAELAAKMNCSSRHISRLENGDGGMSVITFFNLCRTLECTAADILRGAE